MLSCWMEVMPLFFVRWIAKRHCQLMPLGSKPGLTVVQARNDTLFIVKWGLPESEPAETGGSR